MMISGANNLYNKRQTVDELNVFPVPDGDTGTNMSMTVCAMAKAVAELISPSVSKVADTLSYATLRGARGNSGVILSQFFRGIAKSVKGKTEIDAKELADALKKGSDAAYKAVMNPTEGTILTVAREIAQRAVLKSEEESDVQVVLEKALKHGAKVLAKTPEMLPALKKAGVVDAGGQGWLFFLEGALYYLQNQKEIEKSEQETEPVNAEAQTAAEVANIRFMYCTEFIIEKKNPNVNVLAFREAIAEKGDSMLVIDDDDIVKVHIHTNHPGYVLEKAVQLGAMINIKIDNMKHQHQNLIDKEEEKAIPKEKQEIAFVAVCAGDGISGILKELGVNRIIEGGQTMNPSTEDILKAVAQVNAKTVFVFPNNKNIILAANQAKELCEDEIIVIPTRSLPECVGAMLAYKGQKTPADNEKAMLRAIEGITVGQITYAVRDTEVDGTVISEGDILGICKGKIVQTGKEPESVLKELVTGMCDEDSEFLTVYYGQDVSKETAEALGEQLEEEYPELEITVQYGGQPLYYYILSVE
ncbi:MAG: DAK2 domain-containing protein [Ruminococcaceae bacterium]|nr:DAK2 domain-containing protein [Oscillospiraceae bacterium]